MKTDYKKLGDYITQRREKNTAINLPICGVCREGLIPPKQQDADISLYNVFYKNDFIFNPARMELNSITLNTEYDKAICSSLYEIFYINDTSKLLPEFLFVQLKTDNFVRFCEFQGQGSVREYCRFANISEYPVIVPDLKEQEKIVNTYNAITKRIQIKQKINENLEKTAQCLFEELTKDKEPNGKLEDIASITMGQSPDGDSYNENGKGMIFYQGKSDFGFRFVSERVYTNQPTRVAKENDILLSVRAPVGVINITLKDCCIGRGLAAVSSKLNQNSFLFYTLKSQDSAFEIYNGEGTVFGSINSEGLKNLEIVIPNEKEISKFESSVSKIDEQIKNNELELVKLNQLKQLVVLQISRR